MSYFSVFGVESCITLENEGQEIKMSTHMKKFHFRVKFAAFSAPEPKAQVHYCDHTLSVVCPYVVVNLKYIFDFSSETTERNSMKV